MSSTSWAMVAVVLAGCQVGALDPDDGGQSGTAIPPHCVEDSRIAVVDPTVPADGMDFAAADALDAVEGTWEAQGVLQGDGGGPGTVDATVTWDGGEIDAVFSHLVGNLDDGVGMGALGAPMPTGDLCDPVYELGLQLDVVADPYLEASGAGRVLVGSTLALDLPVQIAEEDVAGTLTPPAWDHPEFWDRTVVQADFQYTADYTALNLDWFAINDDPDQSGGTVTTTGGGQAGTGSVEPAGTNSPIAYLQGLVRQ